MVGRRPARGEGGLHPALLVALAYEGLAHVDDHGLGDEIGRPVREEGDGIGQETHDEGVDGAGQERYEGEADHLGRRAPL